MCAEIKHTIRKHIEWATLYKSGQWRECVQSCGKKNEKRWVKGHRLLPPFVEEWNFRENFLVSLVGIADISD